MHNWSDEKVDWRGINEAADYIGLTLRKWGRVDVRDYKEKYGTVRVYCSLGWYSLHSLTHPGHSWIRYKREGILWKLNYSEKFNQVFRLINYVVIPYHKWLYTYVYSRALKKWPHLRMEILVCADFDELLKGLWTLDELALVKKWNTEVEDTSESGNQE